MKNTNLLLLGVIIILAMFLVVLGIRQWSGQKRYAAVYLTSGDLYFGTLHTFPRYVLEDPYLLQQTNDKTKPFSLQKFANVFWGPENELYLNEKNVVWTVMLRSDSPVTQFLTGGQPAQAAQSPTNATQTK